MKTAEEYLKQAENYTIHYAEQEYDEDKLLNVIKQAQIDAVEYTVKKCAEEADVDDCTCGCGYSYGVDEQSILNVFDKIKKEINNGNTEKS